MLKCGTPAFSEFQHKKLQLSPATISEAESIIHSRTLQASETYQSPSGNFSIHYETSGMDAVPPEDLNNNSIPDYVEEVAAAADSSYQYEVQQLGYSDPLNNSSNIDIYILELNDSGQGLYGQSNGNFIEIENDFGENFPPNNDPEGSQIGAIKVTIAHELKHIIQYSANQWRGETYYWLEMDATLMEEVVYDNVNDYYNYIQSASSIFSNPQQSFYPGSYPHVTWALYFEEQFGSQFWVDVWEIISANPYITMVDAITQQLGGVEAFNHNYIRSQLWHFASGRNSRLNFGFQERQYYPTPFINYNFFGDDELAVPDTLAPLSASYIDVKASPFPGSVAINVSESSIPGTGLGVLAYFKDGTVEPLVLYDDQQESIAHTSDWQWNELQKLGIVAGNGSYQQIARYGLEVRSVDPQITSIEQNYPNPFSEQTTIRYSITQRQHVKIDVFDILGRKIATLVDQERPKGIYEETFQAEGRASGVYFYRVMIDGEVTTKKMALIK